MAALQLIDAVFVSIALLSGLYLVDLGFRGTAIIRRVNSRSRSTDDKSSSFSGFA
jgi:hypothetical protein